MHLKLFSFAFGFLFCLSGLAADDLKLTSNLIGGISEVEWLRRSHAWMGPIEIVADEDRSLRVKAKPYAEQLSKLAMKCLSPEGYSSITSEDKLEEIELNRDRALGMVHVLDGHLSHDVEGDFLLYLRNRDWHSNTGRFRLAQAVSYLNVKNPSAFHEIGISDLDSKKAGLLIREGIWILGGIVDVYEPAYERLIEILIDNPSSSEMFPSALGAILSNVEKNPKVLQTFKTWVSQLPKGDKRSACNDMLNFQFR